jgi:PPE-repeat protein
LAQYAATMFNYAGSSATASKVTSFSNAPQIVNPAGTANQAAATAAASSTSTASSLPPSIQSTLDSLTSRLQTLANPFIGQNASLNSGLQEVWFLLTGQTVLPTNLGAMVNGYSPYAGLFYNTEGLPYFSTGMSNTFTQIAKSAGLLNPPAAAAAIPKPPGISAAAGAAGSSPMAAGLGNASHVGHLAVPSSWSGTTTTPTVRPAVQAISEPITAGESGAGNVLGGMPVGGLGNGRGAGAGPRYGFKPTIMARPLPAG